MWNPCRSVADGWRDTHSWMGKVGLVLFYLYVWLNLLDCLSNIIQPFTGYSPCLQDLFGSVETNKHDTVVFVVYLVRMFHLWPFGFYLYAHAIGYTTSNLVIILIFTAATAAWWTKMTNVEFEQEATLECLQGSDAATWAMLLGLPLAAMILGELDARQTSSRDGFSPIEGHDDGQAK